MTDELRDVAKVLKYEVRIASLERKVEPLVMERDMFKKRNDAALDDSPVTGSEPLEFVSERDALL